MTLQRTHVLTCTHTCTLHVHVHMQAAAHIHRYLSLDQAFFQETSPNSLQGGQTYP